MKKTDNVYLQKTTNIQLNKPQYQNRVDVSHINENSDITDFEINALKSEMTTKAPIESPVFTGTPKIKKIQDDSEVIEDIITTGDLSNALEVEILKPKY